MSKLTDLIRPVIIQRQIVGLTGGGATNLDGFTTVGLALSPVPVMMFSLGGAMVAYILRAGTDAEASPTIIRPDDYTAVTNEKVWERFNFNASGSIQLSNGLVGAPALAFAAETNSGLYRNGAADVRFALTGTDLLVLNKVSVTGATNVPSLGIGTAPLRPGLHISMAHTAATATFIQLENTDTTNGNATGFSARTTTTGAGAAAMVEIAKFNVRIDEHDHATRESHLDFQFTMAGVAAFIQFIKINGGRGIRSDSGSLEVQGVSGALTLSTGAGNNNIIFAPNGTGQVLMPAGAIATPAVGFSAETTMGFYRPSAGLTRFTVTSTDIISFGRITFSGATNVAGVGIGGDPFRPLTVYSPNAGTVTMLVLNNADTTNANAINLSWNSSTTGAGAATQVSFGSILVTCNQHDHATRDSLVTFSWLNAGATQSMLLSSLGFRPGVTNTLDFGATGNRWRSGFVQTSLVLSPACLLTINTGTNQRAGDAVLVAGTVTVANTTVTASTRIWLTRKVIGGTPGNFSYTLNAGVGFTINSDNAADTSTVNYHLIEVA